LRSDEPLCTHADLALKRNAETVLHSCVRLIDRFYASFRAVLSRNASL